MTDTQPETPQLADAVSDRRRPEMIADPPTHPLQILKQVGPGLIIAANIVGSGELIMTTKTGAEAGISLLWLILVGCVVKVFVQLELGRFVISHGETTLSSLNRVPGPRLGRINWVVLFWGFMMFTTVGQLGGIVGGVGQALAQTLPFTGDVQDAVRIPSEQNIRQLADYELLRTGMAPVNDPKFAETLSGLTESQRQQRVRQMEWVARDLAALGDRGVLFLDLARRGEVLAASDGTSLVSPTTRDDKIWVVIVGLITATVLLFGRYRLIERFSVLLVVSFTFITIGNVVALQSTKDYSVSTAQLMEGLSFGFPDLPNALVTAFATFGIIGVGATELISYPYWCLEKGYARSTGPREQTEAWLRRAIGWFRVMKYDAFASMVIYTCATAAFYIMGVAVLHAEGRNPEGGRMVSTLAQSYVPIFGSYARWLFLSGAIAVLYSTYLVANASNARMISDFIGVVGFSSDDAESRQRKRLVTCLSVALPLACVAAYLLFPNPVILVAIAGVTQALMLPVLGFSSLYFRFQETDHRLRPAWLWDACLMTSCTALFLTGCWGLYNTAPELAERIAAIWNL
ncbi:MAG: Nramp family divalent metal transporter [Planctomycetaceae bacterium]